MPPSRTTPLSFKLLATRCLSSKCPVCGNGQLFSPFTQIIKVADLWEPMKACASCRFVYRREPGYFFGAIIPVLPILALINGGICASLFMLIVQPEAWDESLPAGVAGTVFAFIFLYRPVVALYVAIDHFINPVDLKKYAISSLKS